MANNISDKIKTEIVELIFSGRKIEAIKLYREATGLGLAEAKTYIDSLINELREKSPEKFTSQGSGCSSAAVFFLAIAGTITYFVI